MPEEVIIPPAPSQEGGGEEELPKPEEDENISAPPEKKQGKTSSEKDYYQLPFSMVHRILRATCLIALIAWFVLIIFLSLITNSNPFDTLIGLAPVLLTIMVTYILVDKYHMESGFLMIFPFIFTGILFMLGAAGLLPGMDYKTLSSVNIIFGLLFEAVLIIHYSMLRSRRKAEVDQAKQEAEHMPEINLEDEESIKSFISSIEDKAKAINAAIGRVYSVRHGGSEALRKKIRIESEDYNKFNGLKDEKPEKRRQLAISLLRNINDKLEKLQMPEKDVFTKEEVAGLHTIKRDHEGYDKVINILIENDKDPVLAYYDSALRFCEDALDSLVEVELESLKEKKEKKKQESESRKKKKEDEKKVKAASEKVYIPELDAEEKKDKEKRKSK